MGNDKKFLPMEKIVEMMDSDDWRNRYGALLACVGRTYIDSKLIEKGLEDECREVKLAAYKSCVGRNEIDVEWIKKGLRDEDWEVRVAAFNACVGRNDIDVELIEEALRDEHWLVTESAYKACVGREDIDVELIKKGLGDKHWDVRAAAFNACVGRTDIDVELIEKGLKHKHWKVRIAAYKALKESGYEIPVIRTFEPPETVYKQCRYGVIVCATIPKDAQVRGKDGYKCRASAAVITDVIGDFKGEGAGRSWHNATIKYHVGDTIEIDNFDYSDEECSTGFHFFCTHEEADEY